MPALLKDATGEQLRPAMPHPDDPEILYAVYEARKLGHPQDTATQAAGIALRTYEDWWRLGKEQLEAAGPVRLTKEQAQELGSHASFAWSIKEADWEMVEDNLQHIRAARGDNWQAAMTLLERRRPKDFGRNQQIQIESNSTVRYVHELGPRAEAAILARREELEALTESGTGGQSDTPPPLLPEAPTTTATDSD